MTKVLAALFCFCMHSMGLADDWAHAEAAYATGAYSKAAQHYQAIHTSGFRPAALYYNYANSLFKQGHVNEAIAAYRKAQYLAPRDPDILINLNYALESVGGSLPESHWIERAGTSLSQAEWARLGLLCYGCLILLLFVILLFASARKRACFGLLLSTLGLLFCIAGVHIHSQIMDKNEYVIQADTPIHFAPLEQAVIQHTLPATALVRGSGNLHNEWIEVVYEEYRGWVKEDALTPLFPLESL